MAAARSIIRQRKPDNTPFGVAYFTLEVTRHDLWNRFVACEMAISQTPVDYMDLKRGTISNNQLNAVEMYSNALKRFPLSLHDKAALTVNQIVIQAKQKQRKLEEQGKTLDVVIVDYLQIIKPAGRYANNKVAEISDISMGLLAMAKDLNVAIIAVSQLSRQVEQRQDKRPVMSDIRESGQIEQDANSIIFLYRPAYYDTQNVEGASAEDLEKFEARANHLHYIIAKARDGITGDVITYCDIGRNHVADKR